MSKATKKLLLTVFTVIIAAVAVTVTVFLKTQGAPRETASPSIQSEEAVQTEIYTAKPTKTSKSEIVYACLDAAGTAQSITVSDRITSDLPHTAVNDVTDLEGIRQISSPVAFDKNGENIVWHMPSTEFIYNGTSTKPLPVDVSLKYYLDGQQVKSDEIIGKSGKITVKIKLKNNEKRSVKTGNGTGSVYSPFIVASAMVLPAGKYADVTVDKGKVLSDSGKSLVITVGFPGLNESLNLDALGIGELDFADEFNISMTAKDFQADNFYFAVIPLSVIDASFALPDSLGDALDGVSKLYDIQEKLSSIDIDSLMHIFASESGNNINDLILSLSGAMDLYDTNAGLIDALEKYLTAENIELLKPFFKALGEADIANNSALLSTAASLLGAGDLINEYKKVAPLINALLAELQKPEIQQALDALPQTIKELKDLKGVLDENGEHLTQIVEFMNSDSFDLLLSLVQDYNENKDLFTALTSTSGELAKIVPYLETWFKLSKDYSLYTKAAPGMKTEVMFIYKTQK